MTSEDLRIAELAMKAGCATIFALNKWDITQTDLEDARERAPARARLRPELVTKALDLADRMRERIPTSELNRFLADVTAARSAPNVRGKRLKMLYMTQYETRPPRFAIQVNERGALTRDYGFFVENRLRARYGLEGVPLVIDYRGRDDERRSDTSR